MTKPILDRLQEALAHSRFNMDRTGQILVLAKTHGGHAVGFGANIHPTLNQSITPLTNSPTNVHVLFPATAGVAQSQAFVDVVKAQGYHVEVARSDEGVHVLVSGKGTADFGQPVHTGVREGAEDLCDTPPTRATPGAIPPTVRAISLLAERAAKSGMARTALTLRMAASMAGVEGGRP